MRSSTLTRLRWTIAALLLLSTALNYVNRLTLSMLVEPISRELSLTAQDYSVVVSAFLLAYAIMYAGSGYIVDRIGAKWGMALFMFGWSVAQALHGLARGKWSLATCRFLLGLTEPGNFPAAVKAITEWFPADRRALGVGLFNAGSSLGSAAAAPLAAFMAIRYGWRSAFYVTGALGLVWLVAWVAIYRPHPRPIPARDADRPRRPVALLLRLRPFYSLILIRFFTDPVIYFVIFWLPDYLHKERGFDLAMVGKYAWVPFLFGDVGYLFGGWLSGFLIRRGWTPGAARKAALATGAALLPAAILTPFLPNAGLALGAICIVVFGNAVWVANFLTLPADLFGGSEVGTASGFSGMGGALGGMLANFFTGTIITRFSYRPIFIAAGLIHPLAAAAVCFLLPARAFLEPEPAATA